MLDLCAAPGSKTAQLIEYLHADEDKPIPSKCHFNVMFLCFLRFQDYSHLNLFFFYSLAFKYIVGQARSIKSF